MVTFQAIQDAALQIAERFKPERIILFGSYAYGKPNEDSDVDYMVLFSQRKVSDRDLAIRSVIKFDFPVDLLVRSRAEFERRIALEDFFLREINDKGVVLYEAADLDHARFETLGFGISPVTKSATKFPVPAEALESSAR
jgi:predicted nucleotidyltransferase